MRGSTVLNKIQVPSYSKSVALGDDFDATESELCVHSYLEIEQADWLRAYKRLIRRNYDANAIAEMLANSYDMTECIALSLRYADQNPSDYLFKRGCELAQTSTVGQLESALYYVNEREEYISVVLALIHYELFNQFELGQYVVRVEIVERDGRLCRRYTNP
ncbi:MAG: hypothetical protein MUC48_21260 [Leptolyngbya sp. Prado105]|jgi:hypothetical protein|nr:hypothetical protein [Leptolyngbya sp. Prado105]